MNFYEQSEGKEDYILRLDKKECVIFVGALTEYVNNNKRMAAAKKLLKEVEQKITVF